MPRRPLRWGVAGHGDIVRRRALPALRDLGEPPRVLWGRDPARTRAAARDLGVPRATTDPDAFAAAADVVYIATPVAAHAPLLAAALRAGRPALVEKPLFGARGPADGPVPPLPPPGGPVAGAAYYRRLAPAVLRLRELLRGRTVTAAASDFRAPFSPAADDPMRWRLDPAVAGGGVLADAGSHRLDLLCHLLGGVPEVAAAAVDRTGPGGVEHAARLRLVWPSGATADVRAAWAEGPGRDRFAVACTGGHLALDPLDSGRITGRLDGAAVDEVHPPHANPHLPLLADFGRAVRAGTAPACPAAEAYRVDRVLTAAYAAADSAAPPAAPLRRLGGQAR
ncbi:Gfo/Idh/MocA family protein [Nocardiopsis trehalosi]|jgi:predicted dehydrogenase|uniref:Gfo/Idh/MocA family protein n=1 Tax=Nocardiopsis trehalosi TaxID=109329 RepID=UPI000832C235|nr:Gfo/Idh/MocA family oxidoreductase [Nocardiopsis trehalosi]